MLKELHGRKVCSCREAAKLLGCTMGRVRQLVVRKKVWSEHVTERALVLDREEIARLAKNMATARATGKLRGTPPGGFVAN